MGMYELNKKLAIARERGLIFHQINNFKMKIYSNLSNINIHYYLKLRIPIMQRLFFMKLAHNRNYIQTHCNDLNIRFQFACRLWYKHNNPGIHI